MRPRTTSFFYPALAALALLAGPARAQLPQARLDSVFPLGGKAGSAVLLDVSGKDLDGVRALRFDHPGLKAEHLKGSQFRVRIASDTPAGTYEVRAVGLHGISGSRLFAVGGDLEEVLEKEPNDSAATAQKVPMNVVVHGKSDGEGDDYFRFPAKKGERVVIDCQALRLDSTLRASLVLSLAGGKELARSRPYHARTDPLLDFVAPVTGDYVVRLHDMTFAGGLPYRLVITTRPHVENVFPAAATPGETVRLTVRGRNLAGARRARGLEEITVPFTAPRDPLALGRFSFLVHPTSPSQTFRGVQFRPKGALNPVTVAFASSPVVLEREPNDSAEKAQPVKLPATVCGRLDRPGDADWYALELKAGEQVHVDLLCERLDFPGDPFVLVADDKGNEVAQLDDHGINFNALAQFNRDPVGTFTAPRAGKYRLLVQDRYRQGGPRHQYVLRLGKPEPDLFPVAIHETNPDPTCPLVRAGGSAYLEVCLNRRNFPGPVVIEAEGLPPGVTCQPVHVSPQTEFAAVVFTAELGAKEWAGAVRLKARATLGGKVVERPVSAAQRRWAIANVSATRACREVCLAVRPGAPYGLMLPEKASAAAGGAVEVKVRLKRHAADFKGAVRLTGLGLPPGVGVATAEVPAGKGEATVRLTVAPNVPPGTYSVVLRGDAQVPFARNPKAVKSNVRVADPSSPMLLTVTPRK
jgi:hypothetical protein